MPPIEKTPSVALLKFMPTADPFAVLNVTISVFVVTVELPGNAAGLQFAVVLQAVLDGETHVASAAFKTSNRLDKMKINARRIALAVPPKRVKGRRKQEAAERRDEDIGKRVFSLKF